MKKIFALNSDAPEYQLLAQVLVQSAHEHNVHDLYCVYDGPYDRFTEWLHEHGVTIFLYRGTLSHEIGAAYRGNKSLSHARGAYLRLELPSVLSAHSISDTWVLYIDVDIMFTAMYTDPKALPELVAGAPDFRRDNWKFINTGVLVMNLPALSEACADLIEHIRSHNYDFESTGMGPCDQGAWNSFFGPRFQPLEPEYNWKPFWGLNEFARIIHFVGPNPFEAGHHLVDYDAHPSNHWSGTHRHFVSRDRPAYYTFLSQWNRLAKMVSPDQPTELRDKIETLDWQLNIFAGTSDA